MSDYKKGQDIEERLINFAIRIVKLSSSLPGTVEGNHIRSQLLRSGTAPAAHYGEARGAESTRDFIHKLKICLKELNETKVWLRIVSGSQLLSDKKLAVIIDECVQLSRIINASIKTSRKNNQ